LKSLNKKTRDCLTKLSRLEAIRPDFTSDLINDMITMASKWEERLPPPECNKKGD